MRYTPPEKRLAETLKKQAAAARDIQSPTGTEREQVVRRLQESVDFLTGQVGYAVGPTDSRERTADPAVTDSANVWEPYSAAFDPILVVVAPPSGQVMVDVSAFLRATVGASLSENGTISISSQSMLGFDVIGPTGATFLTPDVARAALLYLRTGVWSATPASIGQSVNSSNVSRVSGLTPGQTYTFRTRMGSRFSVGSSTFGFSNQGALTNSPRLMVTKLL